MRGIGDPVSSLIPSDLEVFIFARIGFGDLVCDAVFYELARWRIN